MTRTPLLATLVLCLSLGPLCARAQTVDPAPDLAPQPGAAGLSPPGLTVPRARGVGPVLGATQPVETQRPGRKPPGTDGQGDPDYDRYNQRRRPPTVVVIREPDRDLTPQVILPPPAPAPAAPVVGTQAVPLNPHAGPRFVGARGAAPAGPLWTLDQPLPRDVPQLTLTGWRAYGLEAPGPGQSYVRVGPDLLLIEAASRRVLRALPPPG